MGRPDSNPRRALHNPCSEATGAVAYQDAPLGFKGPIIYNDLESNIWSYKVFQPILV